uniref:Uncharacterized protein n=1 Tax=Euplotes crassus TaxID=5936 RepID=A0A7S3NYD0_EUPCR|mmetsp:Transcript_33177/g.32572  ORF Transcript_33177/g.32572 Transcript_33177/m.32572 type:complete len:437 (+) Transcript_33177:705-2015(+)|eukprot:CAMPEP_0197005984 /NCGR_PEP_ID=MMETSP1380-20130617/32432_1 /TAXON_ID=5936 /ORGANISM="Euplotes crassus, Strain CT5" /LENGTH=436 /DNA_ID=CAMNT_0042425365 /DNA_START=700 /DNA_END=2010 /DNA_ORIENTATION=+
MTIFSVDGYYIPFANPSIGYRFRKTKYYSSNWDSSEAFLTIKETIVKAFDGRVEKFYSLERKTYSNVYKPDTYSFMFMFQAHDTIRHIEEVPSLLWTVPSSRNLNTVTNADGTTTTTTTSKTKVETREMAIYYKILYMVSNMGGLYSFLMLIAGLLIRPLINRMFEIDIVNDAHLANQKGLSFIQSKEEQNRASLKNLKKALHLKGGTALEQKINQDMRSSVAENQLLMNDGGEEVKQHNSKKHNGMINEGGSQVMQPVGRAQAVIQENPGGSAQIKQQPNSVSQAQSRMPAKYYTFKDLCCCRSGSNRGGSSKDMKRRFMYELKALDAERDIINIVGKVLAMENKTAMMEFSLNSLLSNQGASSTDSKEDNNFRVAKEEKASNKSVTMSQSEIIAKAKSIVQGKAAGTSINKIVEQEISQIKEDIMGKEARNNMM